MCENNGSVTNEEMDSEGDWNLKEIGIWRRLETGGDWNLEESGLWRRLESGVAARLRRYT